MLDANKHFTQTAIYINMLAGILFLAGALKLITNYFKRKDVDDFLFFILALLFGISELIFQTSALWDFQWWLWHVLRFTAYMVVLYYLALELKITVRSLEKSIQDNEQAKKHLKQAKESAENANRAKTEFLANMSHEIRTPMNAILGFTDILKDKIHDPQSKSYIDSIYASGKTLLYIINDILDLSKIEANKMNLVYAPVNLESLFKEIQSIFQHKIEEKQLIFTVDIDPSLPKALILDEVRLRQILFNLMGNAVKFTMEGYVRLAVTKKYMHEDRSMVDLYITVEDSGIGIPKSSQQKIFSAFTQNEGQSTKQFGGTGLGLAICKKLATLMNGEIQLTSEVNEGSEFTLILHNISVSSAETQSNMSTTDDYKVYDFEPATILIADDIETNRILVYNYLEIFGFHILEAENGLEAINLAKKGVDLIIMDIRMPVKDGYEATHIIKNDPKTAHIPVIALTASVAINSETREKNKIFDYFLEKPINRNKLAQTISKFLKHSKKQEEEIVNTKQKDEIVLDLKLKQLLHQQFAVKFSEVTELNNIDETLLFAQELLTFAQENACDELIQISTELSRYADDFDIENVDKKMLLLKTLLNEGEQ